MNIGRGPVDAAVAASLIWLFSCSVALAETLQRIPTFDLQYDCRDAMPGGGVVDWRSTLELEHCARIVRMARISQYLSGGAQPEFYDGHIEAWRLPANIGVRMPLLRVVFPERVFFDTDEVTLRPEAYDVINIIARNLEGELPDVAMFVAGHADFRGSREYNLDLSSRRANAIAAAIAQRRGARGASVWRVGFGEDMPLYAGNSDLALGYNRRIEFYFASRAEVLQVYMEEDLPYEICLGPDQRSVDRCRADIVIPERGYTVTEVLHTPDTPSAAPTTNNADVVVDQPRVGDVSNSGSATPMVVQRTPRQISVIPRIPGAG